MPFAITTLPNWISDQVVGHSEINTLLTNDAALWDLFGAGHDPRTAEHRGFAFPEAMGRAFVVTRKEITVTATVATTAGSETVTGVGTLFLTELDNGDEITVGAETRVIMARASATSLTVDRAFAVTNAAGTAYSATTKMDTPYYYWSPMSYGWAGAPVRVGPGIIRCRLAWRTSTTLHRCAQVAHDDVAWLTRKSGAVADWRIATCETMGPAGGLLGGADSDTIEVRLAYERVGAAVDLRDEPFQIVVHQNFA